MSAVGYQLPKSQGSRGAETARGAREPVVAAELIANAEAAPALGFFEGGCCSHLRGDRPAGMGAPISSPTGSSRSRAGEFCENFRLILPHGDSPVLRRCRSSV